MKTIKYLIPIIFLVLTTGTYAQQNPTEQIIVTLSKPHQPGYLFIEHQKGSISVTGYEGDVAIVNASPRYFKDKSRNKAKGIKIVSRHLIKLNATENENKITVTTNSENNTIDLDIRVPFSFSLNLTTHDNGNIEIRNLTGEMEINNDNGDIRLFDVAGSAVLSTVDGNISAIFRKVTPDAPMAFSTVEGKIDVTFPPQIKASFKMGSDEGEIYSNFDIEFNEKKTKIEKSGKSGGKIISLESWVMGKVNGGGPEILLKSVNGDIFLRRGK